MKTEMLLSAFAGILFYPVLAAPLGPMELSHQAPDQDLSSSNDFTLVANGFAPTRIASAKAEELVTSGPFKRDDTVSPLKLFQEYARPTGESNGGPTNNNPFKRDDQLVNGPEDNDMNSLRLFALYPTESTDQSQVVAPVVKRATAGIDPVPAYNHLTGPVGLAN